MFSIEIKDLKNLVVKITNSRIFRKDADYTLAVLPGLLYALAHAVFSFEKDLMPLDNDILQAPAIMDGLHLIQLLVFFFISYTLVSNHHYYQSESSSDTLKQKYGVNITSFNMHRRKSSLLLESTPAYWKVCTLLLTFYYLTFVVRHLFSWLDLPPLLNNTQHQILQSALLLFALHSFHSVYLIINAGRLRNHQIQWPASRRKVTFMVVLIMITHSIIILYTAEHPNELLRLSSYAALLVGGGMFLLYFSGRLDNHYINPHWIYRTAIYCMPSVLVVSGVLRAHHFTFASTGSVSYFFSLLMLILKTILALYIIWLYKSEKLIGYMVRLHIHRASQKKQHN